jgi:hypothetical protein
LELGISLELGAWSLELPAFRVAAMKRVVIVGAVPARCAGKPKSQFPDPRQFPKSKVSIALPEFSPFSPLVFEICLGFEAWDLGFLA